MDNVYDIKREKNLNIILPIRTRLKKIDVECKGKIAVIIHLHYLDTIETYLKYVEAIPSYIDTIFTFSDDAVKEELQRKVKDKKCLFIEKENRGRDISALLVACSGKIMKYEYICFLHDKKEKRSIYAQDTQEWIRSMWENMLGSTEYIENIISTFRSNSDLGLLAPPFPLTKNFSAFFMNPWCSDFELTKMLCDKMGLNCNLDNAKPPITLGTVFWAKTAALRKLFELEWKYESFGKEPLEGDGTISHAVERVLAYVVQDAGFESGWVMTDQYAGIYLEYMQDAIKKAFSELDTKLGISWVSEIDTYEDKVREMLDFVSIYEKFYIYGAGIRGLRYYKMLKVERKIPMAFLVSDKKQNTKDIQGIPVYSIDEIDLNEQCGIIVGVGEKYQDEVIQAIKEKDSKFSNIYV